MRILTLILLLWGMGAFGAYVKITASGGSPIPNAYSASDSQSKALNCGAFNALAIFNGTAAPISWQVSAGGGAPTTDYTIIPPNTGQDYYGYFRSAVSGWIYIHADSSTTAGSVYITCTLGKQ